MDVPPWPDLPPLLPELPPVVVVSPPVPPLLPPAAIVCPPWPCPPWPLLPPVAPCCPPLPPVLVFAGLVELHATKRIIVAAEKQLDILEFMDAPSQMGNPAYHVLQKKREAAACRI